MCNSDKRVKTTGKDGSAIIIPAIGNENIRSPNFVNFADGNPGWTEEIVDLALLND